MEQYDRNQFQELFICLGYGFTQTLADKPEDWEIEEAKN